jgi:5-methyltetrahydropteroyltriglutamate--homocysteine methyltransferase
LAVQPVHLDAPIFTDDFRFLRGGAHGRAEDDHPVAEHGALRSGTAAVDRTVYPDLDEFWADLSAAYADEIRALADSGCRYLQLDDTSLACLNDPASGRDGRARRRRGTTPRAQHPHDQRRARRPARGHARSPPTCAAGNFRSSWIAEGGYDFVAEELFGGSTSTRSSASSTTSAPAASPRCGSCRPASRWCSGW